MGAGRALAMLLVVPSAAACTVLLDDGLYFLATPATDDASIGTVSASDAMSSADGVDDHDLYPAETDSERGDPREKCEGQGAERDEEAESGTAEAGGSGAR